jgi:hypothetical protein
VHIVDEVPTSRHRQFRYERELAALDLIFDLLKK